MADEGNDMCWICLEEAAENGSHALMTPCKCPRKVHPQCLARWQLQQAGRHEEKFCRFCNNELADWKHHLTPEELKPEVSKVQPIMVVYFEGQIHRIPVKQGPDGLDEFTGKIRELFRLPEDVDISLTFGCKEPMSGTHLKLEGMGAFDAAVHCASVAAADRQQKMKKSYSTGNLASTTAAELPAGGSGHHMARSASNNSIPAVNSSALSSAAGAPAATAAADRRQRFHGQQQQQQRGGAGAPRSRSFTVGSSSNIGAATQLQQPGRGASETPAAFRNILGLLGAVPGPAAANGSSGGAQAPQAGEQQQRAAAAAGLDVPAAIAAAGQAPEGSSSGARGSSPSALRLKKERLSLRNINELTDVPEADETVAVGSLSGKFKLTLKAFSRKVARSLSFTNKGSSGSSDSLGALSAGSSSSRSPSPRMFNYAAGPGGLGAPSPRSMSSSSLPPASPGIRA